MDGNKEINVLLFLKVFYCLKLTVKIIVETSAEMYVSLLINVYHHTSSGNSEKERWLSKLCSRMGRL